MPPAATLSATSTPSTARNNLALTAVCLVALMFGLEISSVPIILPTLEQQLGTGFQDAQWIMNAYTLACTSVLMAAGTLADRIGRRRMLVLCLWVFGLASLACGLAEDASLLITARFVQGIGAGAMMICQFAILSHLFREPAARARAFVIWGVIAGVGLGFGPMVGALILAVADWRWVFLVHVPLTLFTLVVLLLWPRLRLPVPGHLPAVLVDQLQVGENVRLIVGVGVIHRCAASRSFCGKNRRRLALSVASYQENRTNCRPIAWLHWTGVLVRARVNDQGAGRRLHASDWRSMVGLWGAALLSLLLCASARAEVLHLATGDDYAPFTGKALPGQGMLTQVVRAALAEQGAPFEGPGLDRDVDVARLGGGVEHHHFTGILFVD